jgi:hypothetical protein
VGLKAPQEDDRSQHEKGEHIQRTDCIIRGKAKSKRPDERSKRHEVAGSRHMCRLEMVYQKLVGCTNVCRMAFRVWVAHNPQSSTNRVYDSNIPGNHQLSTNLYKRLMNNDPRRPTTYRLQQCELGKKPSESWTPVAAQLIRKLYEGAGKK